MKKAIKRELRSPSQWALGALGAIAGLTAFLPEAKAVLSPKLSLALAVGAMAAKAIKRQLDAR